ncbi:RNA-directed DNA polymerase, eukaryota, partial [Tanacetum coccineum]
SYKDEDGVILFRQRQVHYRMLILDRHIQRNHESSTYVSKLPDVNKRKEHLVLSLVLQISARFGIGLVLLTQAKDLERPISYDEIKWAVWDCGTNKSSGPDEFTFECFRRYWSLIDHDVVNVVFFASGTFPHGCNTSFITLILKIQDAKVVKDFRPISLIGSVYKIIAKVLANRMSFVMLELISDMQSTFVANRQILDGPFILNELLSWCKHKKLKTMIFKIDFEKAFNYVRWDYLDDVLKAFGFGDKWRGWISGRLKTATGSVLVNGSPISEFCFYKGLK